MLRVLPYESDVVAMDEDDQKVVLKRGFKTGRLMVTIPTMVS